MEQQLPLFARELAPADQQTVRKALSLLECQLRETGASFTSSHAVRDWLRLQLASLEREEFTALFLDNQHRLIAHETLFTGTINHTQVHPREVVKSGMLSLMDAQAHDQWYNSLEKDDIPAVSEANILSTFEQLHQSKGEVFERGVINVFKGLSWDFKSNNPCKFGKKIIATGLVKHDRWGFGLNWGWQRDRLADLERMLVLLDGKPVPDNRADVTRRLSDHIHENRHSSRYEDEMFVIKYFQKGTAHIVFKRPELVDKLNDIIARHYPGALSAR